MESSTIVVVHSELDEQRKIAGALEPLNHPLKCAPDLRAVIAVYRSGRIGLVVTPDIRIPFEKQYVVEGIQRESLRIPVIVLVDEPGQGKCPKATRLLMGLQHYLAWPDEIDDLLPVARGLLRTSRLLEEAATQPGDADWIPNLREVGAAQERRDLIAAMRATNGNIPRGRPARDLARRASVPAPEARGPTEWGRGWGKAVARSAPFAPASGSLLLAPACGPSFTEHLSQLGTVGPNGLSLWVRRSDRI